MNFMKRALTSMFRKPGKTLTLLVLIFVLCNVIAGAVSVKNALVETKHAMLEKMGAEVRVTLDNEAIGNAGENFDWTAIGALSKDTVTAIEGSSYVKRSDYNISVYCGGLGLNEYFSDNSPEAKITGASDSSGEEMLSYFQFVGGGNPTLKAEADGKIKITQGKSYTEDDIKSGAPVALISEELATLNNLSVGQTITMVNRIYDWENTDENGNGILQKEEKKELTVIGIFSTIGDASQDKNGNTIITDSVYTNQIFTTNNTVDSFIAEINSDMKALGRTEDDLISGEINVSFMLDSVDNIEIFEAQNKDKLPRFYTFSDNSDSFSGVEKPMDNMKLIANIILYVAVGATILILGLLVTLFLRDRTREMGIYLSLGEHKWKIVTQILTEVLVVAVVAVTLSVFSGNLLARNLSATLLSDQLEVSSENSGMDYYSYVGEDVVSADDLLDEYNVSLTPGTIAFIYLIGLGSVVVSTLIPIISTLRLKPREILM